MGQRHDAPPRNRRASTPWAPLPRPLRFAVRLASNTSLRGRLSGPAYAPLLQRALERLEAAAELTAGMSDASAELAMEAAHRRIAGELALEVEALGAQERLRRRSPPGPKAGERPA